MTAIGRRGRRIGQIACITMVLLFLVAGLFLSTGTSELFPQAHSATGLGREFSLAPVCGAPLADSHHDYFKALNPADRLTNERATAHHLFKALIAESLGISPAAFRGVLQTMQVRFHNQLFLLPFCGHGPPAFHI